MENRQARFGLLQTHAPTIDEIRNQKQSPLRQRGEEGFNFRIVDDANVSANTSRCESIGESHTQGHVIEVGIIVSTRKTRALKFEPDGPRALRDGHLNGEFRPTGQRS